MKLNRTITATVFILAFAISLLAQDQESAGSSDVLCPDSLINRLMEENNVPGIALGVVKDGRMVLAKGYGYANLEKKVRVDSNTVFQLGSVTKMISGHLLAILVNEGEMTITEPLSDLFPDSLAFPEGPQGEKIKVKDIATHSSEFPRYPDNLERIDPDPIRGYSKEQLINAIELVRIDTSIGVRYYYSNFGYGVLGTAMENRMNKNLSELMKEHIFSPYQMQSSSLYLSDSQQGRLAVPYLEVSPYRKTQAWDMGALAAAGNAFSSISDLNRFMIALMEENEINRLQQSKILEINDRWNYGLGCFIIEPQEGDNVIIYHGGDIDGYASSLSLYPKYKLGIVILSNWGDGRVMGSVFNEINNLILDYYNR